MAMTNIPSEWERSRRGALLASTDSEACAGSKQGMEPQITQTDHVAKAADATAWPPATAGANRGEVLSARRKCGEHGDHGVEAVGFDGSYIT